MNVYPMKVSLLIGGIALFLSLFTAGVAVNAQGMRHVPGDFILHTKDEASLEQVLSGINASLSRKQALRLIRPLCETSHIWLLHADPLHTSERQILERLRRMPGVIAAQFNHILAERSVPNDSAFSSQWQWLNTGQTGGKPGADIKMPDAWAITKGGTTPDGDSIVVAVVDNGINLNHPDFDGNLWINHAEIPGNGLDDDNNGYTDDYLGWNTTQQNDNVGIQGSHGTPVSGMIGARGNNDIGVTGVNWHIKIMTIRPYSTEEAMVIESYSYALRQRQIYNASQGQAGALVVAVNSSWGINYGQPADAPVWCAYYDTMGVHGILNTGATANLNIDIDSLGDLPTGCSSEYLISVTSSNHNDLKTQGAAYGKTTIDLAAPGQNIYTTHNNGGYSSTGGTSFASPTVAGLVGLLYAAPCPGIGVSAWADPSGTAKMVRDAIYNGVDVLPSLQNILVTGGRANAHKSLLQLIQTCSTCPAPHNLTAVPTSNQEAILSWMDLGNVDAFELQWREAGAPDWITVPSVLNGYVLSGLASCTEYEVRLRSHCTSDTSDYQVTTFTSHGCCLPPADLAAVQITDTSVTLHWTLTPGSAGVNLAYLEEGALDYIVSPGLAMESTTISGLIPCTQYQFQLTSMCDTTESVPSAPIQVITGGCPDCQPPSDFDLVYLDDTSVVFTWTPAPNASGYVFAYLEEGALDYVIHPDSPDTIRTETGLKPCTSYTFEVRSRCSAIVSDPAIFEANTTGCTTCANQPICPSAAEISEYEFIESIQIGNLANSSGDNGGYADYTSLSTDLLTYHKYPFTLTPGFEPGATYTETWFVWIDYNADGDFEDPGELAIGPLSSDQPVSGNFKIPGDAVPGPARMRVTMTFNSSVGPCDPFTYGEVEDYCVQIVAANEPCDYPDELSVVDVSEENAALEWTPVTTAVNYIVEFREQGSSQWTEALSSNPFLTLTDLLPCTDYEIRIRTDCDTAQSLPGPVTTFRTKGCGACLDYDYCPAGAQNSPDQWIDEVQIAGVTHNSGPDGGYAFFEDVPINLSTNYEYEVVIKPGASFNINNNYYRVYIDYNHNGTFGPFELVGVVDNNATGEVKFSFEVPNGAMAGPTRLRVVMQSFGGDSNPCITFFTGEVEDYCVHIEKADPPCITRPITLSALSDSSAVLSWKQVIPAIQFEVDFKAESDTTWTSLQTTSNQLSLAPLAACTKYEIRMRTFCEGVETPYGPVQNFKTKGCGACLDSIYCEMRGETSTYEWIEAVAIGTIDHVSGNNQGYAFIDSLTTRLDTNQIYTITITPGFLFGGSAVRTAAWIDFNQDGLFGPGEQIVNENDLNPVTTPFTVPGVPLGETRLRVAMAAFSTMPPGCGNFFYGEVEDYCVQLTSREIPCLVPAYFDTVEVEYTSASVAWDTAQTGIGFILRIRELGALEWDKEMPVIDNSFVFDDLMECTEYEVQLITICQNKLSDAGILIFKTDCTTAVEHPFALTAMRCYPNPFAEVPILEFSTANPNTARVEVFDGRGGLVDHITMSVQPGLNRQTLDNARHWPSGLYVVRVTLGDGTTSALKIFRQ